MNESKRFPLIFILLFISLFIIFFFIAPTKNDKEIHQKEFELTVQPAIAKHDVSCWRFGSVNLKEKPLPSSNILTINSSRWGSLDAALLSLNYVGKVGGVAFESIANPSQELKDKYISISYNVKNPDGKRLMIKIGKNSYNPELHDWLLIPIAIYANSKSTGCVSLFGPNQDKKSYDVMYHSAFINTLLGIRLLHADIFLMNPFDYSKLPMADGKIIYGKGESKTEESLQILELIKLFDIINSEKFKSWVFTDNKVNVKFYVESNKFLMTGEPYYYFWDGPDPTLIKKKQNTIFKYKQRVGVIDNKIDDLKKKLSELKAMIKNNIAHETIEAKLKHLNFLIFSYLNKDIFEEQTNKGEFLNHFTNGNQYEDIFNKKNNSIELKKRQDEFIEKFRPNDESIKIVINKLVSQRNNIVNKANQYISKPLPIIQVISITEKIKKIKMCNLNKPVFDSATTVMRFAAFFRYVKKNYKNSWNNFYKKIATSDRSHFSYTTPTRLDKFKKK